MTSARRPAPPGGMPPPTTVSTSAGEAIRLIPLAAEVTKRHLEQHPEGLSRYGQDLAWQWCMHDMQHVLAWAIADHDLEGQLAWLARVLDAREYPVNNLFDCVLTAADVIDERLDDEVAARWPAGWGMWPTGCARPASGRTSQIGDPME
jgi:hypothetical protein